MSLANTTPEYVNSELELITSQDLLADVAKSVHLDDRMTSIFDRFRNPETLPQVRLERAVKKIEGSLHVSVIPNTTVISLTYRDPSKQNAVAMLQAIREGYLRKHLDIHRIPGQYEFFGSQADYYKERLADTEKKLASFDAGVSAVSPLNELSLKEQSMANFEAQLKAANSNVAQTRERIAQLERQLANTPDWRVTETRDVSSVQVANLRASLLDLQFKRRELLTRYAPSYPLVQEIEAKIADATAALDKAEKQPPQDQVTSRDSTKEWIRAELAKAKADLSTYRASQVSLASSLNDYRTEGRSLNRKSYEQADLLRQQKLDEQSYLLYSQKREEARITEALDQGRIANLAVAELPVVDEPFPAKRPLMFAAAAFMLACVVSASSIAGAEMLNNTVRTPAELALASGVPVLAAIPADEESESKRLS
jgi:uncharacterized protein involved in exopolysaccharide biosynthesis